MLVIHAHQEPSVPKIELLVLLVPQDSILQGMETFASIAQLVLILLRAQKAFKSVRDAQKDQSIRLLALGVSPAGKGPMKSTQLPVNLVLQVLPLVLLKIHALFAQQDRLLPSLDQPSASNVKQEALK